MEKEPKLNFEPITDGLGFHPFSDGLPYAPVGPSAKTQQPKREMSEGAVSAGPSSFARTLPRVSVPVAAPQPYSPNRTPVARVEAAPAIAADAAASLEFESQYGIVYLIKRSLAYSLDMAFNIALCLTALSVALLNQDIAPELLVSPGVLFVVSLFVLVFSWSLVTAEEVAFGTSVGKRVFGLALHGSASAIFLRAFFFVPSLAFCALGLIWALFDSRKRCWHDMIVDIQPTEIARL